MIQRIQTLYLLGSLALIGVMFFSPLATILGKAHQFYDFSIQAISKAESGEVVIQQIPLIILFAVIVFLIFIAVFMYKKRVLQMRVVIYTMLLLAGSLGLTYFYLRRAMSQLDAPNYSFEYTITFPLVAIVMLYLAFRGIRKDELLVRSINRIR